VFFQNADARHINMCAKSLAQEIRSASTSNSVCIQAWLNSTCATMAAASAPQLEGPPQRGRGVQGQYVYAIVMAHPSPATIGQGFRAPSDLDRTTFRQVLVQCPADWGVTSCIATGANNHPRPCMKSIGFVYKSFSFLSGDCSGDCCSFKEKDFV
jgi:hypothetical protein